MQRQRRIQISKTNNPPDRPWYWVVEESDEWGNNWSCWQFLFSGTAGSYKEASDTAIQHYWD